VSCDSPCCIENGLSVFRCSPYQANDRAGACPISQACPTLGAADPESPYHGKREDLSYPQVDESLRLSSAVCEGSPCLTCGLCLGSRGLTMDPCVLRVQFPDWPMASNGDNYARIYKAASPTSYRSVRIQGCFSLVLCSRW
jgi:hypothetical protein